MFSQAELWEQKGTIVYPGEADEVAFPLGGIGTGNVSVGSRGQFKSWEIFNWPGKKNYLPFTFFALWFKPEDGNSVAKILEREVLPPYTRSHGFLNGELAGLPRFEHSQISGNYPFVNVALEDPEVPLTVRMEAFTPLVPLNPEDSAIPAAIIRYHVHNPDERQIEVSVAGTMANAVGFAGYDVFANLKLKAPVKNKTRIQPGFTGIYYTSPELPPDSFHAGSMAIGTTNRGHVICMEEWLAGEWTDNAQDFWENFRKSGWLDTAQPINATGSALRDYHDFSFLNLKEKIGTVCVKQTLDPGTTKVFEFVIAWHFPNRPRGWIEFDQDINDYHQGKYQPVRNHYATIHDNAWEAATYLTQNLERLEGDSKNFTNALYSTSLPTYLIDAIAANIASLRSHCCFRTETGHFFGWEGIRDYVGCGQGNVNHVWNYAQTLAYLFPTLEQSMRLTEFNVETDASGSMPFRARTVLGQGRWEMIPAADGQLGSILRVWREWKLTGDTDFLRAIWKKTRLAMDFAIRYWDTDEDGLPEGQQSNTYDIEFYGPNPMMSFLYCAALKGCTEMAKYLGEDCSQYEVLAAKSTLAIETDLWDGEYFIQKMDDINQHRYQHGIGCHSDQLLGQFMAYSAGMGALVNLDMLRSASRAIFSYNFYPQLRQLHSVQRTYGLNGEAGLVLCSWPKGGRPRFPFAYCDEIWTGVEYQVAVNLVHAGLIEEALTIVRALRNRYDGFHRNPWSEIEAGHHYVRAMASFGLLTAFSGQETDLVNKKITFKPKFNGSRFKTFWVCGKAWGTVDAKLENNGEVTYDLQVLYGSLDGITVEVIQ